MFHSTYALVLGMPKKINVSSGVFSVRVKFSTGGFFRGGVKGIFQVMIKWCQWQKFVCLVPGSCTFYCKQVTECLNLSTCLCLTNSFWWNVSSNLMRMKANWRTIHQELHVATLTDMSRTSNTRGYLKIKKESWIVMKR